MSTAVADPVTVTLKTPTESFTRADLEFYGVDHSKASFAARIFFNQPQADAATPTDAEHGYAGQFHIFGHGGCAGQEGHCDPPTTRRPGDLRPEHQLTPTTKRVVITEPLRRAAARGSELTVTVVAVLNEDQAADYGPDLTTDLLHFDRVDLLTYQ